MDPLTAPPAEIWLRQAHWDEMQAHVQATSPQEACGLVAGQSGRSLQVFPIENQLHSPTRFLMEPRQQLKALLHLDEQGWDLLAIYHSHPQGPPGPSATDVAQAYYPGSAHLIWSPTGGAWGCRAYAIAGKRVHPLRLVLFT